MLISALKISFLFSILILVVGATHPNGEHHFRDGLSLFDQEQYRPAVTALKKVPVDSPHFPTSLIVSLKSFYYTKQWNQFFAYSFFIKRHLVNLNTAPDFAEVLALEVLALAKLCRFQDAQSAGNWSLSQPSIKDHPALLKAIQYSNLLQAYEIKKHPDDHSIPRPALFNKKHLWKITSKQKAKLSHPKNLHMVVKSKCL